MTRLAWIQAYTGRAFNPFSPTVASICLEDLAHSLALQCRFNGHCTRFYSVAEHSVHVSRLVPPTDALWGLLHDASESFIGDMLSPIKPHMPGFRSIEETLMRAVAERFNLPWPIPETVHATDIGVLMAEREQLMCESAAPWSKTGPTANLTLPCWSPPEAERVFLERFEEITH